MMRHGAPDLSNFSVSALADGDFTTAFSSFTDQATNAGMSMMQASSGAGQLYINHGPIFLN